MRGPAIDRFMAMVTVLSNGCWEWTGSRRGGGYGEFWDNGGKVAAHRCSYEHHIGPIPEQLVLDHACHNRDLACPGGECPHRRCVNPSHLEPVTHRENHNRSTVTGAALNLRKTHCKHGHEFTETNTYWRRDGKRECRTCTAIKLRQLRARRRLETRTTSPDPSGLDVDGSGHGSVHARVRHGMSPRVRVTGDRPAR